ncbi:MAG TPA: hypothetical protein VMF30_18895 [Pirellulales bacterium]|nr:hypothetical protein [Pirellulales bacterium]
MPENDTACEALTRIQRVLADFKYEADLCQNIAKSKPDANVLVNAAAVIALAKIKVDCDIALGVNK